MNATPGSLVRYREREWIVLPSRDPEVVLLRPIGGSGRETCGVIAPVADLMGYTLPHERVTEATFPSPEPGDAQDLAAVHLLQESARLLLRDGAAPFKSIGHLSFRPRLYQFVPLMMALRQAVVRLLIADDVGVGKTVEAGLIARELLDRGKITRMGVLCPPYLCDQWQRELASKFGIDAVVIGSSTLARLERDTPPDVSVFQYYPHFVASIDLVKGRNYRRQIVAQCPDLLLVDEAHGAAQPPSKRGGGSQQQRHALLRELARNPDRNLVLLTATPHSGVEASFLSILGLLQPKFASLDLAQLQDTEYEELARHFVQRRRQHVLRYMEEDTPFPIRDETDSELPYTFSPQYRRFYEQVYTFAQGIVRSAETLSGWKRRMRYWSALALLRCITSSPAAAEVALMKRVGADAEEANVSAYEAATDDEVDEAFAPGVMDSMDAELTHDSAPREAFEALELDPGWPERERRRLRQFAREARSLKGNADTKLETLTQRVRELLKEGYRPIIWCRYIATADYVAEELQEALQDTHPGLRIISVTGALPDQERRLKVEQLAESERRVLVATDCLSEGINLQEHFDAAIHYDLPWNPNRLEQREGRVDRFGQPKPVVKVALLYGHDNPVDGAVLEVLIRKARDIRNQLGISVPVPVDSEGVIETVMRSLFRQAQPFPTQLSLFEAPRDAQDAVAAMHQEWERAAEREEQSRARFAAHTLDEAALRELLDQADDVLGSPNDVRHFVQNAAQRLAFGLRRLSGDAWELAHDQLPPAIRQRTAPVLPRDLRRLLERDQPVTWRITFTSPTPEGLDYVGRNHPLVEALAEHLFDLAFHPIGAHGPVSRCGVIQTDAVDVWTTLALLRLRYLQQSEGDAAPGLAEETLVWGWRGLPPDVMPLSLCEASALLDKARPSANIAPAQRQQSLQMALEAWPDLHAHMDTLHQQRAQELAESHRRLMDEGPPPRLEPVSPPDLLGLVVLLPIPGGAQRGVRP